MVTCKINGKPVEVERGTTVLEAARKAGFEVPHFCYHPGLSRPANCRMCLVDASNSPKPIPSCYMDVAPDVEYTTDSEHVRELRHAMLEFILLNHPIDCPICDQAGECELQDNYFEYSLQESRLATGKVHKPKATPFSDKIMFDGERCILCTRCVRFCDEIAQTHELGVAHRAEHSEIAIFPGRPLANPYQMNIVDLCPVGALTSQDFRFKCRVWFMESVESLCTGCARGCNIYIDHHKGEVLRYRPRENQAVNDWWICDAGRLGYHQAVHGERLLAPVQRRDGKPARAKWADTVSEIAGALAAAESSRVALVVSATADNETAYAVRRLRTEVLPDAKLFLTALPDGDDEDDILIRNDKNPNRAGVQAILGANLPGEDALKKALADEKVTHVVVLGGSLAADAVARASFVAVAAVHVDALVQRADAALPMQSHAEHDGTVVNFQGRVQRFHGGIEPVGEAAAGWTLIARISAAMGHALRWTSDAAVFAALATEDAAFAGMSHVSLGAAGIPLGEGAPAPAAEPAVEQSADPNPPAPSAP